MKTFKRSYKILSLVLALCMIAAFLPTVSFAAITYQTSKTGSETLTVSSAYNDFAITTGAGSGGKLSDDTVYVYNPTASHSGQNYINLSPSNLTGSVVEFSFMLNDSSSDLRFMGGFINQTGYDGYLSTGKVDTASNNGHYTAIGDLIKFTSAGVTIANNTAVDEGVRGKTIVPSLEVGVWHTAAIKTPGLTDGAGESLFLLYLDGEEYTIPTTEPYYGSRHMRLYGVGEKQLDNIMVYKTDNLSAPSDYKNYSLVPSLTSENESVTIADKFVTLNDNLTASQLKNILSGADAVRIYTDSTYQTMVDDSALVATGNTVVAVAKNGTELERAYSYYSVGELTYEEPNLYNGTNDLSIAAGTGNNNPATVTKVGGIYGKAADDNAYKIELTTGGAGQNFIGDNCKTLDTRTMEISFALSENSPGLVVSGAFYTSATAADKITVDEAEVSNYVSGIILNISSSAVAVANHPAIASESRNKKLCDIAPGQWITLAMVIPGYNQLGEAASEYLVYVNGTEYKLPLATSTYGTRHMRFSSDQSYPETKTVYYDNFRQYNGSSELYDAAKDKQPVVDFGQLDVFDGNINASAGTTVADFKAALSTKAAVRVFESENYKAQLEDTDEMSGGNMVVFATANNRTTERAYSYYTVNRPLSVQSVKLINSDGKIIKGSQSDLDRMGETYYLDTVISNKAASTTASIKAIAASYDKNGKMVDFESKTITAAPGTTEINATTNAVAFEDIQTPEGGTLKAFLWLVGSNEPLCREFAATFDGVEEYHILAFGNSYSNDAFTYLPAIGKADGVDIYAVNMYTGGCSLSKHYDYMNGIGTYEKRIEYTPSGNVETANVSFADGLNTYGYSWDYITLQSRSVEAYDFGNFSPYLTALADYIKKDSPASEVLMHQTWVLDTETAKTKSQTENLVANLSDEEIRPYIFSLLKQNYTDAAEMIGNPNRIIPVGEAVNYAVGTLGFAERVVDESGNYISDGRGMYRDTTCHLTSTPSPYGRVLAGLTWYEYLTGNDVRENPYQRSDISEEDMALLKEAAHWACTQSEYIKAQ